LSVSRNIWLHQYKVKATQSSDQQIERATMTYADIAVFAPVRAPGALPAYTYAVPDALQDHVAPGSLVTVPFASRKLSGIVVALGKTSRVREVRPIESLLDPQPVVDAPRIELARWMAHEYLAPLAECLRLFLPPGITVHSDTTYSLAPADDAPLPRVNSLQADIIALLRQRSELTRGQVQHAFGRKPWRDALNALVRRGIVTATQTLPPPSVRPRRVQFVRATGVSPTQPLSRLTAVAARRSAALNYLAAQTESVWVSWVYAETGCTLADLKMLEQLGLVELTEGELLRDPLDDRDFVPTQAPPLTPDQAATWAVIERHLVTLPPGHHVFLLHGVTGSGKTEIYLRAAEAMLAQGKQVIALVPEISLTPQTIRRFAARFPGRVSAIHSKLSEGERYDVWRLARAGKVDVIVGARSALFAPLPRLGLIVLDEEHETSYKQDDEESAARSPAYHARDAAIQLGKLTGATVILGSATPSLETFLRARRNEFTRLELPQRIFGHERRLRDQQTRYELPRIAYAPASHHAAPAARAIDLPPVQVVDLRQELREGNRHILSRALQSALADVLARHEQAILFLNRRGSATFVLCRDCGHVLKCPRCDTPLTSHEPTDQQTTELSNYRTSALICHRCAYRQPSPSTCPQCKSRRIRYFGLGTQKVESSVREMFPQAHTLRWDSDTAALTDAEALLADFANHQADVLIGTQMIAKGLDLPLVTLVGVVSADTSLHLPDVRAAERTFQLLAQVAGRAGRGLLGGRVILQTYSPDHYAIQAAAHHDYAAFAAKELAFRREQNYPPYSRLARLLFRDADARRVQRTAEAVGKQLRDHLARKELSDAAVVGPAPCFFTRARGQFRWHILLRAADPASALHDFPLPPACRVDVDPLNLL
jgi:primosomal protein N' (replication factor Y)